VWGNGAKKQEHRAVSDAEARKHPRPPLNRGPRRARVDGPGATW
jgi:hypothetical protein